LQKSHFETVTAAFDPPTDIAQEARAEQAHRVAA